MTNKELQDALNGRLEKFDGEKYSGKEASTPIYHRWYMHKIESELESRGIEIFRAAISGINSATPAWLSRSKYSSARTCRI